MDEISTAQTAIPSPDTMNPSTAPPVPGHASQELYARHEKVYPRQVHGVFATSRFITAIALLGVFYGLPWLSWGDRQAVLLDLPARKFYVFGLTFWPQDFLFLTFLLMIAAFSLFFFTALAGRLWCGYACPQTVWTESFLWIERFFEGDRAKQIKRDQEPWNLSKLRIKTLKHLSWLSLSTATGFSFVAYFTPAHALWEKLHTGSLGGWETFWIGFYGLATYGNAGWLREQVCKYMCPYARFQSAMFDSDTLVISYDEARGEPRGARSSRVDHAALNLGHCVNCTLCVQVCPTGIDIRAGLQYECIGCAACIDVCDQVMARMKYPKGLIRYTTAHALEGGASRIFRPRIIVYAGILICLCGVFAWQLAERPLSALEVLHDRNSLYREIRGNIENVYTLKIANKRDVPMDYTLTVSGAEALQLRMDNPSISLPAGGVLSLPVRVIAPESILTARSMPIRFTLTDDAPLPGQISALAAFIGPSLRSP
jgi:cytochrome c oxidase accessory protein FixG